MFYRTLQKNILNILTLRCNELEKPVFESWAQTRDLVSFSQLNVTVRVKFPNGGSVLIDNRLPASFVLLEGHPQAPRFLLPAFIHFSDLSLVFPVWKMLCGYSIFGSCMFIVKRHCRAGGSLVGPIFWRLGTLYLPRAPGGTKTSYRLGGKESACALHLQDWRPQFWLLRVLGFHW